MDRVILKLQQMLAASEREIVEYILEEAVRITKSQIGYFHFVNPGEASLELFTWSKSVQNQCYAAENRHYAIAEAGIWVDCIRERRPVFHNDYPNTPRRKGYPAGHVPLLRHMSVPLFEGETIIAVVGVGNKPDPYVDEDAHQLQMFLNVMWNVISRKRAEQDLRSTLENLRLKERLEAILDHGIVPTALLDREYQIIYANHAFEQIFHKIVADQSMLYLIHPDDRSLFPVSFDQGSITFEARVADARSGEVLAEISLTPFDDSMYPQSMICNVRDITAHKRAEQQEFELRLQQERLQLLTEFMQNAAHEYRTPLTVIQTNLYLLKRIHPDLNPTELRYLQQIEEQCNAINDLTTSLLTVLRLSRVQSLSLQLQPLSDILKARAPVWSQWAEKAGLYFCLDLDPGDPEVPLNAQEFSIVLDALVHNACRYTPPEGQVSITTLSDSDTARIRVKDTGIGIAPEHLPHLFELFYRVDSAHSERGFGLGLAIAERIVHLHNGRIEVRSEAGAGSTFEVVLPLVSVLGNQGTSVPTKTRVGSGTAFSNGSSPEIRITSENSPET
jgi:PAS domain S-box-containing protein